MRIEYSKRAATTAGINLATAMRYSQSSFLSAVEAGSTITSMSIGSFSAAN
jgi:hypothetical protein